ncbi:hypothetical protein [Neisseria yangbaofengii]|nr:hypothetical protein [Neisseria yangbaofengii]
MSAHSLPNVHLQTPPIDAEGFTMLMTRHERTEQDMAHRRLREVLPAAAK